MGLNMSESGGRKLQVFHTLLKYDAVAFLIYVALCVILKDHPEAIPSDNVLTIIVGGANGLGMTFMVGNGMEHLGKGKGNVS